MRPDTATRQFADMLIRIGKIHRPPASGPLHLAEEGYFLPVQFELPRVNVLGLVDCERKVRLQADVLRLRALEAVLRDDGWRSESAQALISGGRTHREVAVRAAALEEEEGGPVPEGEAGHALI